MIARTPRSFRTNISSFSALALGLVSGLLVFAAPVPAIAAGEKDAEVNKLYDAAMNDDYLNVELAKAEAKLKDAIKKCGTDGCTAKVLAKVHIGLGVIHFANNKGDAAKESFIAGIKADASAALDPTFKGAEIDKIFDDAKKAAGGSSGSGGSAGSGGSGGSGGDGGTAAKPGGDLKHTPVKEQQVDTPIPIYIEVPADFGVKKVTLRYKPFGASSWKPLDMNKVGEGWGIEVPCAEVTTTGDFKYYITADDDSGTVATAGSRNEPYKVSIKNEIDSDPPSLPGGKPPKQCTGGSTCVPGLREAQCEGGPCGEGDTCKTGLFCGPEEDGSKVCKRTTGEGKPWGSSCAESAECGKDLVCVQGACTEGVKPPPGTSKGGRNMVSIEGMLDLLLIGSRELVCSGTKDGKALAKGDPPPNAGDGSYVCFYTDTEENQKAKRVGQFYGLPNDAQGTNGISGGFGVAGGRIGAGFDRQLFESINLTAGVHLGFAFSDFPTSATEPTGSQPNFGHSKANSFMPFWVEGRVGYNILGSFVEPMKLRPYVYTGFGFGQVNAGVPVSVCDTRDAEGDPVGGNTSTGSCPAGSQFASVNAYQITGLDYIPIGVGSTLGLWKGLGIKAEIRVLFMLPTFGVVFQPSLGPVYAF